MPTGLPGAKVEELGIGAHLEVTNTVPPNRIGNLLHRPQGIANMVFDAEDVSPVSSPVSRTIGFHGRLEDLGMAGVESNIVQQSMAQP